MRTLVVGCKGMLGTDLVSELGRRGHEVVGLDLPDLDLTDAKSLQKLLDLEWGQFAWVANCAAYTAVDKAEGEYCAAQRLNGIAPGALAAVCKQRGWRFLQIGTDFVFDGEAEHPYTEEYATRPMSVYGKTKLLGEQNALRELPETVVARTAWLFGPNGRSFPRTMVELWRKGTSMRVVADQKGSPTYTGDLARVLVDLVERNAPGGVYHTAGPDAMSWHELAVLACTTYRDLILADDRPVEIAPIATAEYPTPAHRPPYSVLSFAKTASLGVAPMRPTAEAMAEFVRRAWGG